jgi:hypothetical protein
LLIADPPHTLQWLQWRTVAFKVATVVCGGRCLSPCIRCTGALAFFAVMLTYLRFATLLASALLTVVVADACAPAYLAMTAMALTVLAPFAVMLAYLRSTTLLAFALFTVVVTDDGAPAYLAQICTCSFSGHARISAIRHTPCTGSPDVVLADGPTLFALLLTVMLSKVRPTTLGRQSQCRGSQSH